MSNRSVVEERETTRGFRKSDVEKFRSRGQTQSVGSQKRNQPNFEVIAPDQVTRTDVKRRTRESGFFQGPTHSTDEFSEGFQGEFSDISQDQLDNMIQVFNNRADTLRRVRQRPGSRQLFSRDI